METIPCSERKFQHRIDLSTYYAQYLPWFIHLAERLGETATISLWKQTFDKHDDPYLRQLLSSGWEKTTNHPATEITEAIDAHVRNAVIDRASGSYGTGHPGSHRKNTTC